MGRTGGRVLGVLSHQVLCCAPEDWRRGESRAASRVAMREMDCEERAMDRARWEGVSLETRGGREI